MIYRSCGPNCPDSDVRTGRLLDLPVRTDTKGCPTCGDPVHLIRCDRCGLPLDRCYCFPGVLS